jgi:hypothetical protein
MEEIERKRSACLVRIPEVPDLQNIVVYATDAVYYCLAFKCDAFPEILPILCIRIMSTSMKDMERNSITLQTFADGRGSGAVLECENEWNVLDGEPNFLTGIDLLSGDPGNPQFTLNIA